MSLTRENKINGQKPEWGNPAHIAFVKQKEKQLNGQLNVCEADWAFVRISNKTSETKKPITYFCDPKEADGVQCYIPCPRCGRKHKHVVGYDPHTMLQTEQWATIDETPITCWNCGLEMYIDDDGSRDIYVKQSEDY